MENDQERFQQFLEETNIHPLVLIVFIAKELGWSMAIPNNEEEIKGVVIGTDEYLDSVFPEG